MGKLEDLRRERAKQPATAERAPLLAVASGAEPACRRIPCAKVRPNPNQPRKQFAEEDLRSLGKSIRDGRQLQPIVVRWDAVAQDYPLLVGERRLRGSILEGLGDILALIVDDDLSEDDILDMQVEENCHRVDLNPVELADVYRRMKDKRGWSQKQLAEHLHVSESKVSVILKVGESSEVIRAAVQSGALGREAAYHAARLDDPRAQQQIVEHAVLAKIGPAEAAPKIAVKPTKRERPIRPAVEVFSCGAVRISVSSEGELTDEIIRVALLAAVEKVTARWDGRKAA